MPTSPVCIVGPMLLICCSFGQLWRRRARPTGSTGNDPDTFNPRATVEVTPPRPAVVTGNGYNNIAVDDRVMIGENASSARPGVVTARPSGDTLATRGHQGAYFDRQPMDRGEISVDREVEAPSLGRHGIFGTRRRVNR